jgi:hypothetical protein
LGIKGRGQSHEQREAVELIADTVRNRGKSHNRLASASLTARI